jgi:hypothetical protein
MRNNRDFVIKKHLKLINTMGWSKEFWMEITKFCGKVLPISIWKISPFFQPILGSRFGNY